MSSIFLSGRIANAGPSARVLSRMFNIGGRVASVPSRSRPSLGRWSLSRNNTIIALRGGQASTSSAPSSSSLVASSYVRGHGGVFPRPQSSLFTRLTRNSCSTSKHVGRSMGPAQRRVVPCVQRTTPFSTSTASFLLKARQSVLNNYRHRMFSTHSVAMSAGGNVVVPPRQKDNQEAFEKAMQEKEMEYHKAIVNQDLDKALEIAMKLFRLHSNNLGKVHDPTLALDMLEIARVLRMQGRLDECENAILKGVRMLILEEEDESADIDLDTLHPNLVVREGFDEIFLCSSVSLAELYMHMSLPEKAEPLLRMSKDLVVTLEEWVKEARAEMLANAHISPEHADTARQILAEEEATDGQGHHEEGLRQLWMRTHVGLAQLCGESGKLEEALELYEEIYKTHSGRLDDTEVSTLLMHLGFTQWRMGKKSEAKNSFERGVDKMTTVVGPDHPALATCYHEIADHLAYHNKSDNDDDTEGQIYAAETDMERADEIREAEEYYRKGLKIREKTFGQLSPPVAASLSSLALLARSCGDFREAIKMFKYANKVYSRLDRMSDDMSGESEDYSSQHDLDSEVSYIETMAGLGQTYVTAEMRNEAMAIFRAATDRIDEVRNELIDMEMGEQGERFVDQIAAPVYRDLGHICLVDGSPTEAAEWFKKAISIVRRSMSDDDDGGETFAEMLSSIGNAFVDSGKHKEAEPLLLHSIKVLKEVQGPTSPQVTEALVNLAKVYVFLDRKELALDVFRTCLKNMEKAYGPQHPNVAYILQDYSLLLSDMGKEHEGEVMMSRAGFIMQAHGMLGKGGGGGGGGGGRGGSQSKAAGDLPALGRPARSVGGEKRQQNLFDELDDAMLDSSKGSGRK